MRGGEQGGGDTAKQVIGENWMDGANRGDERSRRRVRRAYATRLVWLHQFRFFSVQWFKRSVQTGKTLVSLPQLSTSPLQWFTRAAEAPSYSNSGLESESRRRRLFTSSEALQKFSAGDTSRGAAQGADLLGRSATAACVILGFFSAEPDQRDRRSIHTVLPCIREFPQSKGKTRDVKTIRSPYRLHWQAEPPS